MGKSTYGWIFFLLLTVFQSCVKEDEEEGQDLEIGDKVPQFVVYSDDNQTGNSFHSSAFVGKRSLLLFFDIHCSDCQREMPVLEELWQEVQSYPGCQFVTIARQQGKEETDEFWEKYNLSMPKYLDPDRSVYSLFAASTVPRIYLIDTYGVIRWMAMTKLDVTIEELKELLLSLEV